MLFFNLRFQSSLTSASDCCQMEWQIQEMHGAAHVTQQCFYEICLQMLEKKQWPLNNSPKLNTMDISCLGATQEAILKPLSEAQNGF